MGGCTMAIGLMGQVSMTSENWVKIMSNPYPLQHIHHIETIFQSYLGNKLLYYLYYYQSRAH